jgi:hypothetical protein
LREKWDFPFHKTHVSVPILFRKKRERRMGQPNMDAFVEIRCA